MKPISQYTDIAIRNDTKSFLYWLIRAEEYIKNGEAQFAHTALTNALRNCVFLIKEQIRIEDCEQPNWKQIFNACLDSAKEEVKTDREAETNKEIYGD